MSIAIKINDDIKKAMLARDKKRLEALRAIKSAVLLLATAEGAADQVGDNEVIKAMQKMVKQRSDAAAIYRNQNRPDMAEDEEFQASVIESYLPAMMGESEIRLVVQSKIAAAGAKGPQDIGKVMGLVMAELNGKADGKLISEIVKLSLNNPI